VAKPFPKEFPCVVLRREVDPVVEDTEGVLEAEDVAERVAREAARELSRAH
jgi:hypothetical protein